MEDNCKRYLINRESVKSVSNKRYWDCKRDTEDCIDLWSGAGYKYKQVRRKTDNDNNNNNGNLPLVIPGDGLALSFLWWLNQIVIQSMLKLEQQNICKEWRHMNHGIYAIDINE